MLTQFFPTEKNTLGLVDVHFHVATQVFYFSFDLGVETEFFLDFVLFFFRFSTSANGLACWFGARWFGFLESPKMKGIGILGCTPIRIPKHRAPNQQLAITCLHERDVHTDLCTGLGDFFWGVYVCMENIWVFPKIGVYTPKRMVYNGKPYYNG